MNSEKNEISEQKNVGIDKSKADAFTGRMLDILNDAALSFMISVGHRTGLYDKMAKLHNAGFSNIEVKQLPHDVFNNYIIVRK